MKGVSGFNGGGAASGSSEAGVVERDYVGLSAEASCYATTMKSAGGVAEEGRGDEREEEAELELGLSLGAKRVTRPDAAAGGGRTRASPWGEYCRILTAKDFPLGSRLSPLSASSSVSSSSAALGGGGGAGTKRVADSVASDVGGGSTSPPSQVVVGWPPIRAFRMNTLVNQSRDNFSDSDTTAHKKNHHNNSGSNNEAICSKDQEKKGVHVGSSRFVKVNMDGDPIGRKVDLNAHLSYETLALALETMFQKLTMALSISTYGAKASKLLDGSSEFALTYEDKDGDWMLVGDVPWGMFLDTVKRLRIMRTPDANGLAPRFQPLDRTDGLMIKQACLNSTKK